MAIVTRLACTAVAYSLLALSSGSFVLAPIAVSQVCYWDASPDAAGIQKGDGFWGGAATNWNRTASGTSENNVPWPQGGTATFWSGAQGAAATSRLTLSESIKTRGIDMWGRYSADVAITNGGDAAKTLTTRTLRNKTPDRTLTIDAVLEGDELVIDSGTVILTQPNVHSGATIVSTATLIVNNTKGSATGTGSLIINQGSSLEGNGVIGSPTIINGKLRPGLDSTPGELTFNGELKLNPNARFIVRINEDHSSSIVLHGGSLTLDSATLEVQVSSAPSTRSRFTIASGFGERHGIFHGLDDGTLIKVGTQTFRIKYLPGQIVLLREDA